MTFLSSDSLDNVLLSTTRNSHARNSACYLPFGAQAGKARAPMAFHGQLNERPLDGYLLGNGYRLYLPRLMRFVQADQLSPFDKGGVNAYAFCLGDPVNRQDGSGRFAFVKVARRLLGVKTKIRFQPGAKFQSMVSAPKLDDRVIWIANKQEARNALGTQLDHVKRLLRGTAEYGQQYQQFEKEAVRLTAMANQLKVTEKSFKKRLEDAGLNRHVVWPT